MPTKTNQTNREDRDLLIKLNTQVEQLISDVKELKDTTSKRVDVLEAEKLSRIEAERVFKINADAHDDHESRLRGLENIFESFKGKYAMLAIFGMALMSILVSVATLYISKHF